MRSFASDNNSGIHPSVLESLVQANDGHAVGYGDDPITAEAVEAIRRVFDAPNALPLFVFNGTGSNMLALDLLCKPYYSIITAKTGHIYADECGAPTRLSGVMMNAIPTTDGKLTPSLIRSALTGMGLVHHTQPKVVYLSQPTELGTVYTLEELQAITTLAHTEGLMVHMDGARLTNAVASLRCSLADMTTHIGIDTLSFGGTKNGLMLGECVLVFNRSLHEDAPFVRKQSGQLASKMRYISAQFIAYLRNDLYLTNALHANSMAQRLAQRLEAIGIKLTQRVETNQIFALMSQEMTSKLLERYFFYVWDESRSEIRLVTSYDTTENDIDLLTQHITELTR